MNKKDLTLIQMNFVRLNYRCDTVKVMATKLGVTQRSVEKYCKEAGIVPIEFAHQPMAKDNQGLTTNQQEYIMINHGHETVREMSINTGANVRLIDTFCVTHNLRPRAQGRPVVDKALVIKGTKAEEKKAYVRPPAVYTNHNIREQTISKYLNLEA